jgi:hypothetical protein
MKTNALLWCFLISTLLFVSCRLEDSECSVNLDIPIRSANLHDSGRLNQTIAIPIQVEIGNGCGRYAGVQTERVLNEVYVYARGQFDGCVCTLQVSQVDTSFSFLPSESGNVIFNFSDGNGNNIKDSIYIRP